MRYRDQADAIIHNKKRPRRPSETPKPLHGELLTYSREHANSELVEVVGQFGHLDLHVKNLAYVFDRCEACNGWGG